jgi:hypothetical protein
MVPVATNKRHRRERVIRGLYATLDFRLPEGPATRSLRTGVENGPITDFVAVRILDKIGGAVSGEGIHFEPSETGQGKRAFADCTGSWGILIISTMLFCLSVEEEYWELHVSGRRIDPSTAFFRRRAMVDPTDRELAEWGRIPAVLTSCLDRTLGAYNIQWCPGGIPPQQG